jgi:tetratricopeptide (TPR) repeat protein
MLCRAICTVFSSYDPSPQEALQLMKIHHYWDAVFLLDKMINSHPIPRDVLLRAQCFLNLSEFILTLRDARGLVQGRGLLASFGSFSSAPEGMHLDVQPSKAELAEANVLISQAMTGLGDYAAAHQAAESSGNAKLVSETNEWLATKNRADALARAHEFEEAVALYDRMIQRSPNSVSLLVQRAVLTSLARNHGRYAELSADLLRQFPLSPKIKHVLGRISFCNCSFNESDGWAERIENSYDEFHGDDSVTRDDLHQSGRTKKRMRLEAWRLTRKDAETNLKTAEDAFRSSDLKTAVMATKKLLSSYLTLCWKRSVFRDRLFLLHVNVLKAIGGSNHTMLEVLSRYIHQSPKLVELYVERARIHAENEEIEASKYDLLMVERLSQKSRGEKINQKGEFGL